MTTLAPTCPLALRDTALTVTELNDAARPADTFESFRATCLTHVNRLREELTAAGHPPPVVQDAIYAQCALFDEVALRNLDEPHRSAWEREPLQVKEFQSHNAGEELIARMERRLTEPESVVPLLMVFHTVLGLGFQGKFALEGAGAREALMRAIDERLVRAGVRWDEGPIIVTAGKTRGVRHMPPIAWVGLAVAGAGAVYFLLDRWLTASIAQLAG
ncbi:DotU/TssL family secretion system protein [Cupriavidus pauculus]|uniref:DotU family type IV/VI secretion system protein n=1 Tax=Cupriavidus pauculus TaxID=82633 RepID=A0A3G8H2S5_9BURK|nr:DotU/TssL family secretion system protein [Cupriavidus pauculus]AZG14758.1 DotU family type IV/VI secretion system protein [Cupriavidus pauculus]